MGHKQSSTANWSVDDWAYGTGENAVPIEDVANEVSKLPGKLFGAKVIQNDESMLQMQHDLLSFDDTIKRFFRRKKNKQSNRDSSAEGYHYSDGQAFEEVEEEEEEEPTASVHNPNYMPPIYPDRNASTTADSSNRAPANTSKAIWRCSHCAEGNKGTDAVCRRCGQAETTF